MPKAEPKRFWVIVDPHGRLFPHVAGETRAHAYAQVELRLHCHPGDARRMGYRAVRARLEE